MSIRVQQSRHRAEVDFRVVFISPFSVALCYIVVDILMMNGETMAFSIPSLSRSTPEEAGASFRAFAGIFWHSCSLHSVVHFCLSVTLLVSITIYLGYSFIDFPLLLQLVLKKG